MYVSQFAAETASCRKSFRRYRRDRVRSDWDFPAVTSSRRFIRTTTPADRDAGNSRPPPFPRRGGGESAHVQSATFVSFVFTVQS